MEPSHSALGGILLLTASAGAASLDFEFALPGPVTLTPQSGMGSVVFDLAALDPRYAGRWQSARAESALVQFVISSFAIPDPVFPKVDIAGVPTTTISSRGFDADGVYRIEQDDIHVVRAANQVLPLLVMGTAGTPQQRVQIGAFEEVGRRVLASRERVYDFVPEGSGSAPEIIERTSTTAVEYALTASQRSLVYEFNFNPGADERIEFAFDMAFGSASLELSAFHMALDIDPASLADQIPLPPAVWLLGSSLALVGVAASRRRRTR